MHAVAARAATQPMAGRTVPFAKFNLNGGTGDRPACIEPQMNELSQPGLMLEPRFDDRLAGLPGTP
jgi:hypothetical protein